MPNPLANSRIVVTGGAGFIGSHIVESLLAVGADTTVIDDLSSGTATNLPDGIPIIRVDVSTEDSIEAICDARPDLVIHLAAQVSVPVSVADPARDRRINLLGTENVIAAAERSGARRIVFASSGGAIYGQADGADEATLPRPANPYGIHKLAAEGYVRTSSLTWGIARYANVYGPRQRSDLEGGVAAIFCERISEGLPVEIHGTGEQTRDFVFVEDVAEATLRIAATGVSGTWNVGTGEGTSVQGLLESVEAIAGRPATVSYGPSRPGDVLNSRLSIDRIRRELGWRPRFRLTEGLRGTVGS